MQTKKFPSLHGQGEAEWRPRVHLKDTCACAALTTRLQCFSRAGEIFMLLCIHLNG